MNKNIRYEVKETINGIVRQRKTFDADGFRRWLRRVSDEMSRTGKSLLDNEQIHVHRFEIKGWVKE